MSALCFVVLPVLVLTCLLSLCSGQGKSTVIQLIENYYHPARGTIYYRGVDMKALNVKWLRNQIGLVSQEPLLFDQSIAENIKFGMPEATQEDIEKAAKEANAHDFISKSS